MNIFKRAWLYITRKRKKSLIMLLILFGMSTAILSGISIKKSTSLTEQNIKQSIQAGFQISRFMLTDSTKGALTDEMIEKVANLEGIKSYNKKLIQDVGVKDINLIQPQNQVVQYDQEFLNEIKDVVRLSGNQNSEFDTRFRTGMVKLTEGRHITKDDQHKVLISKELAELNNLKIGSKIALNTPKVYQTSKDSLPDTVVEVVGIFEVINQSSNSAPSHLELVENSFIIDLQTVKAFTGNGNDDDVIYHVADFTVNDPAKLDSIIEQVKQLPFNWEHNDLTKNENLYAGISGSLEAMNELVNMMLFGTIIVSIIILVLILTFWIQGRIHETGILLSIGIPKHKIVCQYILELLIVATISFSLSYFSGNAIAQTMGENLLEKAGNQSQQEVMSGFGGFNLGADPESSAIIQTISEIDVTITGEEMIYVAFIGTGIIIASVTLASLSIFRLEPKQILSQMS